MAADPIAKTHRHQAILAVLQEKEIGSQEELRRALKRRGHLVTQATLSRDLKELRIPCVPTENGYRYELPEVGAGPIFPVTETAPGRMRSVAAMEVTRIEANEVCVIVRTLSGHAPGVGVWIDGQRQPDILATIAGDDTVLIVPRNIKRTKQVEKALVKLFGLDRHTTKPEAE